MQRLLQTLCNFVHKVNITYITLDINAKIARLLMIILVPSHFFYIFFIYSLQKQFDFSIVLTIPFVLSYFTAVTLQLVILLYLAYVSVFWAWKQGINPDNSAIPFTSALADVLGNCLMAGTFTFLHSINDPNAHIITPSIKYSQFNHQFNISFVSNVNSTMLNNN